MLCAVTDGGLASEVIWLTAQKVEHKLACALEMQVRPRKFVTSFQVVEGRCSASADVISG